MGVALLAMAVGAGVAVAASSASKSSKPAASPSANAALATAKQALEAAKNASVSTADNEDARKAAEAKRRQLLASGTFTRNFLNGGQFSAPSVGYATLMGQ